MLNWSCWIAYSLMLDCSLRGGLLFEVILLIMDQWIGLLPHSELLTHDVLLTHTGFLTHNEFLTHAEFITYAGLLTYTELLTHWISHSRQIARSHWITHLCYSQTDSSTGFKESNRSRNTLSKREANPISIIFAEPNGEVD